MCVVFTEKDKRLELSIEGYEIDYSPDQIEDEGDYYDANWLIVRVTYSGNGKTQIYKDNCLLSYELDALTKDIDNVLNNSETGLITDFLEPNLKLAVTVVKGFYAVQVRFIYDMTDGWKDIYITQAMTPDELRETNNRLKEMCAQFPEKKRIKSDD